MNGVWVLSLHSFSLTLLSDTQIQIKLGSVLFFWGNRLEKLKCYWNRMIVYFENGLCFVVLWSNNFQRCWRVCERKEQKVLNSSWTHFWKKGKKKIINQDCKTAHLVATRKILNWGSEKYFIWPWLSEKFGQRRFWQTKSGFTISIICPFYFLPREILWTTLLGCLHLTRMFEKFFALIDRIGMSYVLADWKLFILMVNKQLDV